MTAPAADHVPQRSADRRPNRALAASALIGPTLAVAGLLLTYAVRDQLPESVAVHWGPGGQPDRFASLTEAAVTAAVMTSLLPLIFVVLGAAWHPSARGPLAGFAGALAVFLGGLLFGSLVSQRPGEVPQAFPAGWLVPTLVTAAVVGLGLWRYASVPFPSTPPAPPPRGGLAGPPRPCPTSASS